MSILTQNGDTNGQPVASAEFNSANGARGKAFTTLGREASQKNGSVGEKFLPTGMPTDAPADGQSTRRQKERVEVMMFWALAKALLKKHGGKVMEMESDGIPYLSVSFPREAWAKRKSADGRTTWMPKALLADSEILPTVSAEEKGTK